MGCKNRITIIPFLAQTFFLLHTIQAGGGALSASFSTGSGTSFLGDKAARA